MIQVLNKAKSTRPLARQFAKCVLQDKENLTIFFNRLDELNEDFSLFSRTTGKDYNKKDPTKMLMHIEENVGVNYDAIWVALEVNSISQTCTPEEILKEAKHNLKEHWNKKLKDKTADEGKRLRYGSQRANGQVHPLWKGQPQ